MTSGDTDRSGKRRPTIPTLLLLGAGLSVVAVTVFRVPLVSIFSIGVLLICPVLMIGMHRGHAGGQRGRASRPEHTSTDPAVEHGAGPPRGLRGRLVGAERDGAFTPGVRGRSEVSSRGREV